MAAVQPQFGIREISMVNIDRYSTLAVNKIHKKSNNYTFYQHPQLG